MGCQYSPSSCRMVPCIQTCALSSVMVGRRAGSAVKIRARRSSRPSERWAAAGRSAPQSIAMILCGAGQHSGRHRCAQTPPAAGSLGPSVKRAPLLLGTLIVSA